MTKWKKTFLFLLITLILTTGLATVQAEHVKVHRDSYGVPHIYSDSIEGLYYGFGYSVAQDRLFQLEMLKRVYYGRSAEVFGEDTYNLDLYWLKEYPSRKELRAQFEALDGRSQTIMTSYAKGVNGWIDKVLADKDNKMSKNFHQLGIEPEYWDELDVAAVYLASLGYFMDISNEAKHVELYSYLTDKFGKEKGEKYFNDLVWRFDPGAYTTVFNGERSARREKTSNQLAKLDLKGASTAYDTINQSNGLNGQIITQRGYELPRKIKNGSSRAASYVVLAGPERSETGKPLLLSGPQFGHWLPSMLHEVGLHGAGIDVVGSTLVGTPFIMFGHTDNTAFASTAGAGNIEDIYEEKLNPENPDQYFYKGQWRDMQVREKKILVKGESEPRLVKLYSTIHGPVVSRIDTDGDGKKDVAYSKKIYCHDTYLSGITAWTKKMVADTPKEMIEAGKTLTLSINFFYTDNDGNIAYYHCGKYPIRSKRQDFDPRFPTPGTGEYEPTGFIDPDNHPHVINPENDLIVNWNNKPSADWDNGDLGSFLLWAGWSIDHRSMVLAEEVEKKGKLSVDDLEEINYNIVNYDKRAFQIKPYLIKALEDIEDSQLIEARKLLADWNNLRQDGDKDKLYDSPGYTIYDKWWSIVNKNIFEDELGPWYKHLLDNYSGYSFFLRVLKGQNTTVPVKKDYLNGKEWQDIFIESLEVAIEELEKEYKTDNMDKWLSDIKTMKFIPASLAGVPTSLNSLPSIPYMDRGSQNHIVELLDPTPQGENVTPPGQSGFVSKDGKRSDHFADQIDLFKNYNYKNMLFDKGDILINSESTEILIFK